jgi:abortive infection bacteriophage resistance protein
VHSAAYPKSPLTVEDQVQLLIKRGMVIDNAARAKHFLTHINYYRLSAYWLPFEVDCGPGQHAFRQGTSFNDIIAVYGFDRELRILIMDVIERFEIALRARWANYLSVRYGAFCHEDKTLFKKYHVWDCCMKKLDEEYQRSRETFAEHYRNKYGDLKSPPIWVACELFSFGHLSHWFANLKIPKDRQAIADAYEIDETVLVSFTHHLTIVRNHCAHHGRIWNRKFSFRMKLPNKKPRIIIKSFEEKDENYLYNTLTMLGYLVDIISPNSTWVSRVKNLISQCGQIRVTDMGFPGDWLSRYPWAEN